MLCVLALEKAGITPDKGDVLVTGAAGGVGSVAIALLDSLGYRVVASEQEAAYLRELGADEIVDAPTCCHRSTRYCQAACLHARA
jgi:acrylyl-CoA reductase (NADPH)